MVVLVVSATLVPDARGTSRSADSLCALINNRQWGWWRILIE